MVPMKHEYMESISEENLSSFMQPYVPSFMLRPMPSNSKSLRRSLQTLSQAYEKKISFVCVCEYGEENIMKQIHMMLQKSTRQRRNEQACEVELNNRKTNFFWLMSVCVGKGLYTGLGVWLSSEKKEQEILSFQVFHFSGDFCPMMSDRQAAGDSHAATLMNLPSLYFASPFGERSRSASSGIRV